MKSKEDFNNTFNSKISLESDKFIESRALYDFMRNITLPLTPETARLIAFVYYHASKKAIEVFRGCAFEAARNPRLLKDFLRLR